MTRRMFWRVLVATGLASLGAGWNRARRDVPRIVRRAARARAFPGRLRRLRDDEVERSGRWAG